MIEVKIMTVAPPGAETIWTPNKKPDGSPGPQYDFIASLEREVLLGGSAGGGKCLQHDTPILTVAGWKPISEVRPGDQVFKPDGLPTDVLSNSGILLGHVCYRITFDDGSEIVADRDHQWRTYSFDSIDSNGSRWAIKTTEQIAGSVRHHSTPNHAVQSVRGLDGRVFRPWRFIESVDPVASVPVSCIKVANPDGMFVAGQNRIPTHNSDGLLMAATQDIYKAAHRAILFRRSFPEMRDLIRRSIALYPSFGGYFKSSSREWFFPSGAIIEFGYLDKSADKMKYQGRAFNFIGYDELTQWPNPEAYVYLLSRLRANTGSGVTKRVRSTCNPGGPGHGWVQERFKIPGSGAASEVYDPKTKTWRLFMPARISDNPYLSGTSYEDDLEALPEDTKQMLKYGRWDVVAGAMFSEFDHRKHTCEPFLIEPGWPIWRGADDGYNAPAVVLWFTKYDARIFVIDELHRNGMTPEAMAEEVLKRDKLIGLSNGETNQAELAGAIDGSAFNETGVGNSQGTGRGQIMNKLGCRWEPAQKGPGSRVAGWNLIHSKLRPLLDGKPAMIIFRRCKNLIRTIPVAPKDENNVEDVDPEFTDDHNLDGLRYGLQYKPRTIEQRKLMGL